MDKQKRFQKQKLNSDDNKRMENDAKAVKGVLGLGGVLTLLYANRDNLKTLGKSVIKLITK